MKSKKIRRIVLIVVLVIALIVASVGIYRLVQWVNLFKTSAQHYDIKYIEDHLENFSNGVDEFRKFYNERKAMDPELRSVSISATMTKNVIAVTHKYEDLPNKRECVEVSQELITVVGPALFTIPDAYRLNADFTQSIYICDAWISFVYEGYMLVYTESGATPSELMPGIDEGAYVAKINDHWYHCFVYPYR